LEWSGRVRGDQFSGEVGGEQNMGNGSTRVPEGKVFYMER